MYVSCVQILLDACTVSVSPCWAFPIHLPFYFMLNVHWLLPSPFSGLSLCLVSFAVKTLFSLMLILFVCFPCQRR